MLTAVVLSLSLQVALVPNLGQTPTRCPSETTRAGLEPQDRSAALPNLLDRSVRPQAVRRYLLLDRRDQNNCPLPISFPVDGSGQALGRNLLSPDSASRTPPRQPERTVPAL